MLILKFHISCSQQEVVCIYINEYILRNRGRVICGLITAVDELINRLIIQNPIYNQSKNINKVIWNC